MSVKNYLVRITAYADVVVKNVGPAAASGQIIERAIVKLNFGDLNVDQTTVALRIDDIDLQRQETMADAVAN